MLWTSMLESGWRQRSKKKKKNVVGFCVKCGHCSSFLGALPLRHHPSVSRPEGGQCTFRWRQQGASRILSPPGCLCETCGAASLGDSEPGSWPASVTSSFRFSPIDLPTLCNEKTLYGLTARPNVTIGLELYKVSQAKPPQVMIWLTHTRHRRINKQQQKELTGGLFLMTPRRGKSSSIKKGLGCPQKEIGFSPQSLGPSGDNSPFVKLGFTVQPGQTISLLPGTRWGGSLNTLGKGAGPSSLGLSAPEALALGWKAEACPISITQAGSLKHIFSFPNSIKCLPQPTVPTPPGWPGCGRWMSSGNKQSSSFLTASIWGIYSGTIRRVILGGETQEWPWGNWMDIYEFQV